jgi:glycosyltransferase involved in cell wall biosynthesis
MPPEPIRVLHIAPCIYPATKWGGPAFSTYEMLNALARCDGIEVALVTTDTAGPQLADRLMPGPELMANYNGYQPVFTRRIWGDDFAPRLILAAVRAAGRADVVHVSGTYNYTTMVGFLAAWLRRKPLVWTPRGALQASEEWTGRGGSRAKLMWERVLRLLAPQNAVMHVTAENERELSLRRVPGMATVLSPNGVKCSPVPPHANDRAPGEPLRLAFLSRVHPKKGVDLLLQLLAQLGPGFVLSIYGTGEASYLRELEAQAEALGIADRVTFHGHVSGADKERALTDCDIFVLPSYSENFGIAIAEALAAGRPVVTTVNTPWTMLEAKGVGRCVENEVGALTLAVQQVAALDRVEVAARAHAWISAEFSWNLVVRPLIETYRALAR